MVHKTVDSHMRIGDVFIMRFDGEGCEQGGIRPGVVIQNNVGNKYSPNIIALPITSSIKKSKQPTHVFLNGKDAGLKCDSMVICENPERMSKDKVLGYISTLPNKYMKDIAVAFTLASSVCSYLDEETMLKTWKRASELNES